MREGKGGSEFRKQTTPSLSIFAGIIRSKRKLFFNEGNLLLFSVILNGVILCYSNLCLIPEFEDSETLEDLTLDTRGPQYPPPFYTVHFPKMLLHVVLFPAKNFPSDISYNPISTIRVSKISEALYCISFRKKLAVGTERSVDVSMTRKIRC